MTATELAYLAGIIDGQGYVGLINPGRGKGRPRPQLEVSSINPELIRWLKDTVGGYCPAPLTPKGYQQVSRWRCSGKEMSKLANHVLPYVQIHQKRAKLEACLRW